jgi:hypothetical protein
LKYCKGKAHDYLEADITNIKKNLSNDLYETIEKFQEDMDLMRSRFSECGLVFTGKNEILLEECLQLSIKASDYLLHNAKKGSSAETRRIKEKYDQLEAEKIQLKVEATVTRR